MFERRMPEQEPGAEAREGSARVLGGSLSVARIAALQHQAGNRAVGMVLRRALQRQCEEGQRAPGDADRTSTSDTVMSVALRAATGGYAGVMFTITNQDCRLLLGYQMQGEGGLSQRTAAPGLVDDLRNVLRWSFSDPGEYRLELERNQAGELAFSSWEPVRRLTNNPTPGVAQTGQGQNVVVVMGSPSPDQYHKLQFITAGLRETGHTIWLVERTGYELAHVDLTRITERAPGGRVRWITPESGLVEQLNALPAGSLRRLVVYSHGVEGQVMLRYGWSGRHDYGLNRSDARRINGGIFSPDAVVDLESCQGGTNLDGGSLAQVIADRTERDVVGWTGRTSYADVNAGRGGVRGSEYGLNWDAVREAWVRNVTAGDTPHRQTFRPATGLHRALLQRQPAGPDGGPNGPADCPAADAAESVPPAPAPTSAAQAPVTPTADVPAQASRAATAPTAVQSAVPDVAQPVGFTEIVNDDRLVRDLPRDQAFGGLAEVERFAGALADEYARRRRSQIALDLLRTAQAAARRTATAERLAGESARERSARINAATRTVQAPSNDDIDAAVAAARAQQLTDLTQDWQRHEITPRTQGHRVSTLANAWCRNRQEELLFRTEQQTRPRDQARMWTNVWIEPAAAGDAPVERDTSVGVNLGTAPGGSNASDAALVDPRTITFLTDLHNRCPAARFGTYLGHGSAGFARRGLSVDITMAGRDRASGRDYAAETSRGWYERSNVADLFDAIDASAAALGYRFFAIYNDFAVARYANSRLHNGNVGFAGNIDRGGGVNYHGGGYKLHVHLDLVPPALIASDNPARRAPAAAAGPPAPAAAGAAR